jgi:hypothetical protein
MKRIGVSIDLGIMGVSESKTAISSVAREIEKLEKAGKGNSFAAETLRFTKDRLTQSSSQYQNNLHKMANDPRRQGTDDNGQPTIKMNAREEQIYSNLTREITRLTNEIRGADFDASPEEYTRLAQDLMKNQKEFAKLASGEGAGLARDGTLRAVGFNQLMGMFNQAMNTYAGSIDQSGIRRAYASGDVFGGRLAETQRRTAMLSGAGQTMQTIGGGMAIAGKGVSPLAIAGYATMAAGSITDAVARIITGSVSNEVNSAKIWENLVPSVMQLAAMTGRHNDPRGVWRDATRISANYGFSSEEGMELATQAASQGLSGSIADRIFRYERATGADRGTISSIDMMSERYRGGDALAAGWAGLNASGLQKGQYSEFLRAMERVMSDGISKGFIRSAPEVSRSLTMLAQIDSGNNPLWKGESGARRLQELDGGSAGARGLESANNIMVYRAFQQHYQNESPAQIRARMERGFSAADNQVLMNYLRIMRNNVGHDNELGMQLALEELGIGSNASLDIIRNFQNDNLSATRAQQLFNEGQQSSLPDWNQSTESNLLREANIYANSVIIEAQRFYDTEAARFVRDRGNGRTDHADWANVATVLRERSAELRDPFGVDSTRVDDLNRQIEFAQQLADYDIVPESLASHRREDVRNDFIILTQILEELRRQNESSVTINDYATPPYR